MSPDQLPAYLLQLQAALRLADWDIVCDGDHPLSVDGDDDAQVSFAEHGRAFLQLAPVFWTYPPAKQRAILVHELGHIMCRRLCESVEAFEATTHPKAWRLWEACWTAAEEAHVEHLSRLLSPTLPLPPG